MHLHANRLIWSVYIFDEQPIWTFSVFCCNYNNYISCCWYLTTANSGFKLYWWCRARKTQDFLGLKIFGTDQRAQYKYLPPPLWGRSSGGSWLASCSRPPRSLLHSSTRWRHQCLKPTWRGPEREGGRGWEELFTMIESQCAERLLFYSSLSYENQIIPLHCCPDFPSSFSNWTDSLLHVETRKWEGFFAHLPWPVSAGWVLHVPIHLVGWYPGIIANRIKNSHRSVTSTTLMNWHAVSKTKQLAKQAWERFCY